MKRAIQLFEENRDLIAKFSCELSTRRHSAYRLMPVTERFLKEAIYLFGNQNLQDFYYAAEEYIIDHLGLYVETNGKSLQWDEEHIEAACLKKKQAFTRKLMRYNKSIDSSFACDSNVKHTCYNAYKQGVSGMA